MMETFLEDAENSLHHRVNARDGSESSEESDDPFLYDKFLQDPAWAKADQLEEAKPKNLVDPGLFRYNKRVFVTSLPALMLVLALGGETLVLMVAVGTAVITLMAQLGDSHRCVITFVIIFIPTHTFVLAAVIPLLWLSLWHFLLVVLVNIFVVLTAGWILIQFRTFRVEEPSLSSVIEQQLFTLYPLVCTSLSCWALRAVVSISVIPVIFSMVWFVLLQLYLLPTLSSFKTQSTSDENLDVVQVPVVVLTVVIFIVLGPLLHIMISLVAMEAPSLISLVSLVQFAFVLSLTLFLSTLLSIRQIFEYLGLPYTTAVYMRWASGVICTLLCYPVLHGYGLDSHFLPLLPAAIGIFAALGVVLAFKKKRIIVAVLALVLVASLVALFCLWIQRMPHNLQHYFMGIFPINVFYLMICINFFLCLVSLWTASVDARGLLGVTLIVQSLALTVCEVSLHNANLYSTSLLQLTAVLASYTIHRLQVAEKISRQSAILSSTVHMAKSLASTTSLVLDGGNGEITFVEMVTLGAMTYAIMSVFVYSSLTEKSGVEVIKQLLTLMVALAVNSHHLLLPLSMIMFQGSTSYTNVIGLWCMLGGGFALLYSQTIGSALASHIVKVALAQGVMGVIVMVIHPQLTSSLYSVFQWMEIISLFTLAAILLCRPKLSPRYLIVISLVLAICPGVRASLFLWSRAYPVVMGLCVLNSAGLLLLTFVCVFISEMTEASDKVMKYSVSLAVTCCGSLLALDVANMLLSSKSSSLLSPPELTFWQMPAWSAALITLFVISVILKIVQTMKGPDKLPVSGDENPGNLSLPLTANIITVVTFIVACSQGPSDCTLYDLWCCASTLVFGCLHPDSILIPRLSGDKQATPTIMASQGVLVIATLLRSRFWTFSSTFSILGGFFEVVLAMLTVPVLYVMWGILWKGQIISEPIVVFMTPYCFLLVMCATTYTAWILALSTLVAGVWMMMYKLPMVPYANDYYYR